MMTRNGKKFIIDSANKRTAHKIANPFISFVPLPMDVFAQFVANIDPI